MSDQANFRKVLLGTLTQEQHQRYVTNPWFKRGLDTFAEMIPVFIEGLAAQSDKSDASLQRRLEEESRNPLSYLCSRISKR
jgi:hypothetical protein